MSVLLRELLQRQWLTPSTSQLSTSLPTRCVQHDSVLRLGTFKVTCGVVWHQISVWFAGNTELLHDSLEGLLQAGYSQKLGTSQKAAVSSALASSYAQQSGVQAAPLPAVAPASADIFLPTRPSHGRTAASNVTVRTATRLNHVSNNLRSSVLHGPHVLAPVITCICTDC